MRWIWWPFCLARRIWLHAVADDGAVRFNLRLLAILTALFSLPDLGQGFVLLSDASGDGPSYYGAYVAVLGLLELSGALLLAWRSPLGRRLIIVAAAGFYPEAALGLGFYERSLTTAVLFAAGVPANAWVLWFLTHRRVRAHVATWRQREARYAGQDGTALRARRPARDPGGPTRRPIRTRRWVLVAYIWTALVLIGVAIALVPPWRHQVMTGVLLVSGQVNVPAEPPSQTRCTSPQRRQGARSSRHIVVPYGRVVSGTLVSRALHGARRPYFIYLPPGYDQPRFRRERYPVVYLLHGAPGEAHDWVWGGKINVVADRLIAACRITPTIIMMPDGNGGLERDSQYVNRWNGKEDDATYIVRDVVSFVDRHFRTLPDPRSRAIMGNSEGGYGAVNLAVQHPDVFAIAVSLSGYFRADQREVAFGDNPFGHDRRNLRANSPILRVPLLPAATRHRLHILLYDGSNDDQYAPQTRAFVRVLARAGVPHFWESRPTEPLTIAYHTWIYWRDSARDALIRLSGLFAPDHRADRPGDGP
jgi:enterochelin esterase-like enzyme